LVYVKQWLPRRFHSSSKACFSWKSNTDFGGGVSSKIYRVTKHLTPEVVLIMKTSIKIVLGNCYMIATTTVVADNATAVSPTTVIARSSAPDNSQLLKQW